MKLAQLLAKELKEWPEGVTHLTQSEVDYEIYDGLDGNKEDSVAPLDERFYASRSHSEGQYPMVTRAQWQAEREKMNKPKWIRHRGGNQPVEDSVKVEYRMRDGDISTQPEYAATLRWSHWSREGDIMAYRVIEETKDQEIEEVIPKHMALGYASKEEMVAQIGEECPFAQVAQEIRDGTANLEMLKGDSWVTIGSVSSDFGASVFDGGQPAKGEEVKKTNFGAITYKLEIDATEAIKEIDSLVAKWGQIESPLKWRDEIIELEAYEEEFRREREKLIRKLESEGLKPIDHMAPVYGEQIIDMSDWRNWQPGDIVECLIAPDKHEGYYFSGINYKINAVDLDDEGTDCEISVYCNKAVSLWCPSSSFKFIRRP